MKRRIRKVAPAWGIHEEVLSRTHKLSSGDNMWSTDEQISTSQYADLHAMKYESPEGICRGNKVELYVRS